MPNPSSEFRGRASSLWGYSNVVARGKKWLLQKKIDSDQYMLDVSLGDIHYGPSEDQEIDTAWVADTGAWQYQMVLADFHAHARNILNAGTLVEYRNPYTNEWITFQPLGVNYANEFDSRQQLALPQAVSAVVNDDTLYWENGYGTGRHFQYVTQTERLQKLFIVDALANLPAPEPWMTGTVDLEIEFIIAYSAGVNAWVDGVEWDKTTKVQTGNRIEFRDTLSNVNWYLDYPRADDSNPLGSSTVVGQYQLRKQGNNFYITVRIPKTWVDAAVFPIKIDPTVTPLVAASADDAMCDDGGLKDLTGTSLFLGVATNLNPPSRTTGLRFILPSVTNTDNIDLAYIEMVHEYGATSDMPIRIIGDAQDNAPAWVNLTTFASETTYTTNFYSTHVSQTYSSTEHMRIMTTSQDISAVVEEITSRAGWSAGNGIRFMVEGYNGSSTYDSSPFRPYDASTTLCARLHVEYSSSQSLVATAFTDSDSFGNHEVNAMAIVPLTTDYGTSNPLTTASVSPTSGNIVLVFATMVVDTTSGDLHVTSETCSGLNITWNALHPTPGSNGWDMNFRRNTHAWWGISDGTSGTIQIGATPDEGTFQEYQWSVVEIKGADNTTPFGTRYMAEQISGTSISVTVSETPDTNDWVLAYLVHEDSDSYTTDGLAVNGELDSIIQYKEGASNIRSTYVAIDKLPDSTPTPGFTWTTAFTGTIVGMILNVKSITPQGLTATAYTDSDSFGSPSVSFPTELTTTNYADSDSFGNNSVYRLVYYYPDSDVLTTGWIDQNGGTSNLYTRIDEVVPDDNDYLIYQPELSSGNGRFGIVSNDPQTGNAHFIRYRFRKDGTEQVNLIARLLENTTVIASWSHTNIADTWVTVTQELTPAEADSITNYSILRIELELVRV